MKKGLRNLSPGWNRKTEICSVTAFLFVFVSYFWGATAGAVVNVPPVITEGSIVSVAMSQNSSPTPFALTLHATDANFDPLTWSILTPASNGVAGIGAGTGVVSYAPTPCYNGADSFVVQVSDGNGGTDSIIVSVTIQPEPMNVTTTVTSNHNSSTYGQLVTFTATVSGSCGTPTGTVTFMDGETTLGTGTLDGTGQATLSTAALTAGVHAITAIYGGYTNFAGSTSTAVNQVVNVTIPSMNEWGMIIFMALAGLGAAYYLRRQRRT